MKQVEYVDTLIVGSGPAGSSTALHLVQKDPAWAERILVVDKAVHPREKLCGGGITHGAPGTFH
jgi:flavin-dependent dehydrogenase